MDNGDVKRFMLLLTSMNRTQERLATRISANQLLLIGIMRMLKEDPAATLELERTLAEFVGDGEDRDRLTVVEHVRTLLEVAYD